MKDLETEATLGDLVEASNRTTHAVRAIAILFLYYIPWGIVSALIVGVSYLGILAAPENASSFGTTLALGITVSIIGIVVTLVQAFRELRKSKVW